MIKKLLFLFLLFIVYGCSTNNIKLNPHTLPSTVTIEINYGLEMKCDFKYHINDSILIATCKTHDSFCTDTNLIGCQVFLDIIDYQEGLRQDNIKYELKDVPDAYSILISYEINHNIKTIFIHNIPPYNTAQELSEIDYRLCNLYSILDNLICM